MVLLGSALERLRLKYHSLNRIRKRHGWVEVYHRLRDRWLPERGQPRPIEVPPLVELLAGLPTRIRRYDRLNGGALIVDLLEENLDVLILAGCGMVSATLAATPRLGCVNGHPAILPGARGVDVLEWCLIEGRPFGITAHLVAPQVDAGPILLRLPIQPDPGESLPEFRQRVVVLQAEVVAEAACRLASGNETRIQHDLGQSRLYYATTHAQRQQAIAIYHARFGV